MTTLEQAIKTILDIDFNSIKDGKYHIADDFYYNVFEYEPKLEQDIDYEAHREYIDLQFVISGTDKLMITDISALTPSTEYNSEKDVIFYKSSSNNSSVILNRGSLVILYPKDAHKSVKISDGMKVRKIVGKLRSEAELR